MKYIQAFISTVAAPLMLLILFNGCSRPFNPPATTDESLLNSPVDPSSSTSELQGPVYPHSQEFKLTGLHGRRFKKNEHTCKSCHGDTLEGGTSRVSCTTCHKSYPHAQSMSQGITHGNLFLQSPELCVRCHKLDKPVPNSGVTRCVSCHNFPHVSGWSEPTQHGTQFLAAKDKQACLSCHGPESGFKQRHPELAVSCADCHFEMPHRSTWSDDHGPEAENHVGDCLACHEGGKRLMPEPYAEDGCFSCHDQGSIKKP